MGDAVVATVVGAGVTFAVLWLLSLLNTQVASRQALASNVRSVVLSAERKTRVEEERMESDPEPSEERVMTVDLDRPAVAPLELEPLDLALEVPSLEIPPVRIAVNTQPRSSERRPATSASRTQTATTELVDEGMVDQPPREHPGNRKPMYPPREERLGIEAQVVVLLIIDERGNVEDVQALSGPRAFRKAALDAARSWSFTPAIDDG
ncbi:MAG TPA: TonB family protein, partial [Planctomycetota bacterium]|nr:TonB family protein [Planctomycetota bacterium]